MMIDAAIIMYRIRRSLTPPAPAEMPPDSANRVGLNVDMITVMTNPTIATDTATRNNTIEIWKSFRYTLLLPVCT